MKGIQIYFTGKERLALLEALSEYTYISAGFADTDKKHKELIKNGLDSAENKLYKGLKGYVEKGKL